MNVWIVAKYFFTCLSTVDKTFLINRSGLIVVHLRITI